ncbi:polysaccharide deacetylase [Paroceanicella profunda]|uniref:Chitooligosaccharide deacetylase n=1 Tax=Paroceanicella profunda TaxID=2579971 RepID=A0A5B8FGS7_9RHOB|nr:polysaccharide deacetylase [Paroceanicella profunda]QDL91347.1 polysaccharide deacetylase [Paroceanicella profunda]
MATDRYIWPEGFASATAFTVDVDAHSPWLWQMRDSRPRTIGHLEQRRFGPRVGLGRILDLLEAHGIKGTFFVPGIVAEEHPDMLPRLLEGGHEIGLHGYFHELVDDISDAEFTHALECSLELFERQTGRRPLGFRSPAWEMTPHMLAECRRLGLYDSSLMGYDHPYTMDGVAEIPVQWGIDDAIFFKFLGGGADKWPPQPTGPVGETWAEEWRLLHRWGGLFMLTVHDWISGRAQRIAMLDRLLGEIRAAEGVWIATVGEIAAHHMATQAGAFAQASALPGPISSHPARTPS